MMTPNKVATPFSPVPPSPLALFTAAASANMLLAASNSSLSNFHAIVYASDSTVPSPAAVQDDGKAPSKNFRTEFKIPSMVECLVASPILRSVTLTCGSCRGDIALGLYREDRLPPPLSGPRPPPPPPRRLPPPLFPPPRPAADEVAVVDPPPPPLAFFTPSPLFPDCVLLTPPPPPRFRFRFFLMPLPPTPWVVLGAEDFETSAMVSLSPVAPQP